MCEVCPRTLVVVVLVGSCAVAHAQSQLPTIVRRCPYAVVNDHPAKPEARFNLDSDGGAIGEWNEAGADLIAGAAFDARGYTRGHLAFGGQLLLGVGQNTKPTVPGVPSPRHRVFALQVQPMVGVHFTRHVVRTIDGTVGLGNFCDGHRYSRRFETHVFGFEPELQFVPLPGRPRAQIGGHLTWEYDSFAEEFDDFNGRKRSMLRLGYLSYYGVGGAWTVGYSIGGFNNYWTFGLYHHPVVDRVEWTALLGVSVGASWL